MAYVYWVGLRGPSGASKTPIGNAQGVKKAFKPLTPASLRKISCLPTIISDRIHIDTADATHVRVPLFVLEEGLAQITLETPVVFPQAFSGREINFFGDLVNVLQLSYHPHCMDCEARLDYESSEEKKNIRLSFYVRVRSAYSANEERLFVKFPIPGLEVLRVEYYNDDPWGSNRFRRLKPD